jgi:methionyl aminopeptidase
MTLAIEPMVNQGTWQVVQERDGWTYRTKDRSLSAHFEHTIAITREGCEILTLRGERRLEAAAGRGQADTQSRAEEPVQAHAGGSR